MSTDRSAHPQLSWSRSTATTSSSIDGAGGVTNPANSHVTLSGPVILSPSSIPSDLLSFMDVDKEPSPNSLPDPHHHYQQRRHLPTLGTRRSHVPTDIDIRSISSHAQVEVLVQRAQQLILDMEGVQLADDLRIARSLLLIGESGS
jgi:hypothetical protein